jgi:uncharacterized membrane protein YciS (DUF1049 family)
MKYIVLSESELSNFLESFSLSNWGRFEVFSSKGYFVPRKINKPFSFPLFYIGIIVFAFAITFQYWANSIDNPQILSSKPFFHLSTGFIFAFELTLFVIGLIIFARFLVVNKFNNTHLQDEIKELISTLEDEQVLLLFYDNVNDFPQTFEKRLIPLRENT